PTAHSHFIIFAISCKTAIFWNFRSIFLFRAYSSLNSLETIIDGTSFQEGVLILYLSNHSRDQGQKLISIRYSTMEGHLTRMGYSYAGYIQRQAKRYPIMMYTLVQCVPCQRAKHLLAVNYADSLSATKTGNGNCKSIFIE
ncbi:hypothetical protein COOONC_02828, partial [Cooperia oncophora]